MLLDIGGVLVIPDLTVLADELAAADVEVDLEAFRRAHYHGMAGLDAVTPMRGAWLAGYVEGVLDGLGLHGDERRRFGDVLLAARRLSDLEFWRHPVPGSMAGLRQLSRLECPLAFVSNSDGTAARKLRELAIAQVGPGPGVPVAAIVDSAVAGVAKPDPRVFRPALDALGVDPAGAVYVGDSRAYDVDGARAAGLRPLHFDPFGACTTPWEHEHVTGLGDVVRLVVDAEVPSATRGWSDVTFGRE